MAGFSAEEVELPAGSSVRDLLASYEARVAELRDSLPSLAIAVNQEYASPDVVLRDGDEVALLPPVSGGADSDGEEMRSGRVLISRSRIDVQKTVAAMKHGEDGAVLTFEGIVRNQTHGRKTLYLEYEAYEEMALAEMERLADEALEKFQIRDLAIVHRLGRLEIGETSVLIAVASAHRAAAFEACRWLIDTLKRTVPIWKKEYFEDGAVWADSDPFPNVIPRANS